MFVLGRSWALDPQINVATIGQPQDGFLFHNSRVYYLEQDSHTVMSSDTQTWGPDDLAEHIKNPGEVVKLLGNPHFLELMAVTSKNSLVYSSKSHWHTIDIDEVASAAPSTVLLNDVNNTYPIKFSPFLPDTFLIAGACNHDSCLYSYCHKYKQHDLAMAKACEITAEGAVCLDDEGIRAYRISKAKIVSSAAVVNDLAITDLYYYHGLYIALNSSSIYLSQDGSAWANASFDTRGVSIIASSYASSVFLVDAKLHLGSMHRAQLARSQITIHKILDNVHQNINRQVDFETVQGVAGVVVTNQVAPKSMELQSVITFDNGDSWNQLGGNTSLHLHSVVRKSVKENHIRRNYRSLAIPGILMAVGNHGPALGSYLEGDTYLSTDNGYSWRKALDGPHLFLFGTQGSVIVAISDLQPTDTLQYSLDLGLSWTPYKFVQNKLRFSDVVVDQEKPSEVFLAVAQAPLQVVTIDFHKVTSKLPSCKLEDYKTVVSQKCFKGFKQAFSERTAGCRASKPITVDIQPCVCQASDFDCAVDFYADSDGNCVTNVTELSMDYYLNKYCDGHTLSFWKPSSYMLKDGNRCTKQGVRLDEDIETPCSNYEGDSSGNAKDPNPKAKLALAKISQSEHTDESLLAYGSSFNGTVIQHGEVLDFLTVLTSHHRFYISYNRGSSWYTLDASILWYIERGLRVVLFGADGKVYYSLDGRDWRLYTSPVDTVVGVAYHARLDGRLIISGTVNRNLVSFISLDYGSSWNVLQEKLQQPCVFAANSVASADDNLIYCYLETKHLMSSSDFFASKDPVLELVSGFYPDNGTMLATTVDGKTARLQSTVDGKNWKHRVTSSKLTAESKLTVGLKTGHDHPLESLYLVQEGNSHYGNIYKSNTEGDQYILVMEGVHVNGSSVDFTKAATLNGILLANSVVKGPSKKVLQTQISFNDGGQWSSLPGPRVDSGQKPYPCNGQPKGECSLHLHGNTMLKPPISSEHAVGMFVATGNVGDSLAQYKDSSTFLTTDAGRNWKEIFKGPYQVVQGGRGALIVAVEALQPTRYAHYSTDQGTTWNKFQFHNVTGTVQQLLVVDSRTVMVFRANSSATEIISLDFSLIFKAECAQPSMISNGDFEEFRPGHPCLFGTETIYYRKKKDVMCYSDDMIASKLVRNCECTADDFECEVNHFRNKHGDCVLSPDTKDAIEKHYSGICHEMGSVFEYEVPSGYRKVSVSQCHAGLDLEKPMRKACQGKQSQYDDAHIGLRGFRLFLVSLIVILGVAVLFYFGSQFLFSGNYGQIRLGEESDNFYLQPNFSLAQALKQQAKWLVYSFISTLVGFYQMVQEVIQEGNRTNVRYQRVYDDE